MFTNKNNLNIAYLPKGGPKKRVGIASG